jgi:hypothetical protein
VPEAASIAREGTEVSIASVGFGCKDFFDTFFGCTFGSEDDFASGTAATVLGC